LPEVDGVDCASTNAVGAAGAGWAGCICWVAPDEGPTVGPGFEPDTGTTSDGTSGRGPTVVG
jgi:hypothetical protein